MTVALEELRDEIRREELSVGLSTERPLTRRDIDRRRRQIAYVGLVVFFGVVVSTLRANVWGNSREMMIDPNWLRAAAITAAGGFIAYVVEKERHLRRLAFLESEEHAVQLVIADRLLESAALADASRSRPRRSVCCRPTVSSASPRFAAPKMPRRGSAVSRSRRGLRWRASRCCCRARKAVTIRRRAS